MLTFQNKDCFQIHLILLKHDVIVQFMKLLEIQPIFGAHFL